jgi:hypothetical protein
MTSTIHQVRPVLAKLRSTLVGAAGLLLVCTVLLTGLIKANADEDGVYGAPRLGPRLLACVSVYSLCSFWPPSLDCSPLLTQTLRDRPPPKAAAPIAARAW